MREALLRFMGGPFDGREIRREPTDVIVVNDAAGGTSARYVLTTPSSPDGALIYRLA